MRHTPRCHKCKATKTTCYLKGAWMSALVQEFYDKSTAVCQSEHV